MLAWMPKHKGFDRSAPKSSVYKNDFRGIPPQEHKQQLVIPPKTSFDEDYRKTTTLYRYGYGDDNPNKDALTAMCPSIRPESSPERKPRSSYQTGRESVATCMSWYTPKPPPKPTVPASTQTSKLTPAATEICLPCAQTTTCQIKTPPIAVTQEDCNTRTTIEVI